jgi:hypothetical protein
MGVVFQGMVFADYHQFCLMDTASRTEYSDAITDTAVAARALWKDNVLVIFTARNMSVPVTVELHENEPVLELDPADHVVEAGLRSAGVVAVLGCSDYLPNAARFPVPAGDLKATIVFRGLGTLSEDGLAGDDSYTVHLWPGRADGVRVLKP